MEYIFYNILVFAISFLIGLTITLITEYRKKEKYKFLRGYNDETINVRLLIKLLVSFIISLVITLAFYFISTIIIFETLSVRR